MQRIVPILKIPKIIHNPDSDNLHYADPGPSFPAKAGINKTMQRIVPILKIPKIIHNPDSDNLHYADPGPSFPAKAGIHTTMPQHHPLSLDGRGIKCEGDIVLDTGVRGA